VIQRICAVSLAVLIALPLTAPFATIDLRNSSAPARAASVVYTVATAATDDDPIWTDRAGRNHHAMPLAALNSGYASPVLTFLLAPLSPPAVTSVPHNAHVIAAVLRV
jgi:hypothetical protein